MVDFDYVIVGAGTVGCVLAGRLSEDPGNRVLMMEYGCHDTNPRPIGPGGKVEASLPVQVAGNTQACAMTVAWIAVDLIREGS
jgi:choline dehydrogenase-like flavoprotein